MAIATPIELPRVQRTPLSRKGRLARLLKSIAAPTSGDGVYFCVKTQTKVDVGRWMRKSRVWAIGLTDHLALVARGRDGLAERIPYEQLRESVYNHVTGTLVLAPHELPTVKSLKLNPVDAHQLLAQIYFEENDNA
ncbi:MAG: hypothetical protein IH991_00990 [Planctomycetes bacterium]|nr:hypothetical protein [Planctomycetota bacterium]